jgi:hypothetical protein
VKEELMTAFAIGDRVRFNDNVDSAWWFKAGQTGKITSIASDDSKHNITVLVDVDDDDAYVDAYMIDPVVEREFNIGDRIRLLDDNGGYGRRGVEGVIEEKQNSTYLVRFDDEFHGSNTWWTVAEDMELLISDLYQDDDEVYPDDFMPFEAEQTEIEDLDEGYYEPCSRYRVCMGENDKWVVEATRVKVVAVCADEDEAIRIAEALNFTSGNMDYV